jgi:hypothetical protein
LYDEENVVRPAYSTGKVEVFQPHGRVGVPEVLDDVQRCTEMLLMVVNNHYKLSI